MEKKTAEAMVRSVWCLYEVLYLLIHCKQSEHECMKPPMGTYHPDLELDDGWNVLHLLS